MRNLVTMLTLALAMMTIGCSHIRIASTVQTPAVTQQSNPQMVIGAHVTNDILRVMINNSMHSVECVGHQIEGDIVWRTSCHAWKLSPGNVKTGEAFTIHNVHVDKIVHATTLARTVTSRVQAWDKCKADDRDKRSTDSTSRSTCMDLALDKQLLTYVKQVLAPYMKVECVGGVPGAELYCPVLKVAYSQAERSLSINPLEGTMD